MVEVINTARVHTPTVVAFPARHLNQFCHPPLGLSVGTLIMFLAVPLVGLSVLFISALLTVVVPAVLIVSPNREITGLAQLPTGVALLHTMPKAG